MLAHSLIRAKSSDPARYMLFLHGILGTRANWRGIARRFVEARPDWGAILLDLREHGDSLGRPAPQTIRAAARDVTELEQALALPVGGALGHSFGGKLVLEWLRSRAGTKTEAWIIDSSPSASAADRDETATAAVLELLDRLPRSWTSGEEFVRAVQSAGQPEPIAQWLAMNLRRDEDGGRTFGPDLKVIRSLLEDYARTDLWPLVEALPEACSLGIVIGGRSPAFSSADRDRAARLAERDPRVSVEIVEAAGHWVHIDAPDELLALMTAPSIADAENP